MFNNPVILTKLLNKATVVIKNGIEFSIIIDSVNIDGINNGRYVWMIFSLENKVHKIRAYSRKIFVNQKEAEKDAFSYLEEVCRVLKK